MPAWQLVLAGRRLGACEVGTAVPAPRWLPLAGLGSGHSGSGDSESRSAASPPGRSPRPSACPDEPAGPVPGVLASPGRGLEMTPPSQARDSARFPRPAPAPHRGCWADLPSLAVRPRMDPESLSKSMWRPARASTGRPKAHYGRPTKAKGSVPARMENSIHRQAGP